MKTAIRDSSARGRRGRRERPPSTSTPACQRLAGGIWVGTDPISLTLVPGLVAETGELFFDDAGPINGGVYYVGQFAVDASNGFSPSREAPRRKSSAAVPARQVLPGPRGTLRT